MLVYLKNSEVTPEISLHAIALLRALSSKPLGTTATFTTKNGARLVARLERHYHPPGGTLKPWGPHKGISVLRETADPPLPAPETVAEPPKAFILSKRSLSRLEGLDERLVQVVHRAIEITPIDFAVIEGLRTKARQAELVSSGASQTMNSRHLDGHAVDLAPWVKGAISWNWDHFHALAPSIFEAAKQVECPIEWGGNWASFPDGPHWQIPWGK